MVEQIQRRKPYRLLTPQQLALKEQRDKEYEEAVQTLSHLFYQKKRTVGVTAEEENTYRQGKRQLWKDYCAWALANGIDEEISLIEICANDLESLKRELDELNETRTKAGLDLIKIQVPLVME